MARRWPDTLPAVQSDGYGLSPADQILRTDLPIGALDQRRLGYDRLDAVDALWRMTDAQFALFRAWHDDDPWSETGASNDLSSWTAVRGTLSVWSVAGPSGEPAWTLTEDGTTGSHRVEKAFATIPADDRVMVVHATVRSLNGRNARVGVLTKAGTLSGITVDPGSGTVVSVQNDPLAYAVTDRGDSWLRVTVRASVLSGGTSPRLRVDAMDGTTASYAGDTGSGLRICETLGKAWRSNLDLYAHCDADGNLIGAAGGAGWFYHRLTFGGPTRLLDARFTEPFRATVGEGLAWDVRGRLEVRNR